MMISSFTSSLSTPNWKFIFIELLPPPAGDNVHSFISNKVMSNIPRWRGPDVRLQNKDRKGVEKSSIDLRDVQECDATEDEKNYGSW